MGLLGLERFELTASHGFGVEVLAYLDIARRF